MEIKAKCRYDLKSITALVKINFSKRSDPKRMLIIYFAVCLSFILFAAVFMIFFEFNPTMLVSSIVLGLCLLFVCYTYFLLPKIQYKKMGNMKDADNEYTFRQDAFEVTSLAEGVNGTLELKYSIVYKVLETSEYIFIYQNNIEAFIVDKSTINGGTEEDLRKLLITAIGEEKYVPCNY